MEASYPVRKYSSDQGEMIVTVVFQPRTLPGFYQGGTWLCDLTYEGVVRVKGFEMSFYTPRSSLSAAVTFMALVVKTEPWASQPFMVRNKTRIAMWVSREIKDMQ